MIILNTSINNFFPCYNLRGNLMYNSCLLYKRFMFKFILDICKASFLHVSTIRNFGTHVGVRSAYHARKDTIIFLLSCYYMCTERAAYSITYHDYVTSSFCIIIFIIFASIFPALIGAYLPGNESAHMTFKFKFFAALKSIPPGFDLDDTKLL